jgi:hypothetical protein
MAVARVCNFRVSRSCDDGFVELFNEFDHGDNNPFPRSRAPAKDGVLYRHGERTDIVAHELKPEFDGSHFAPTYNRIVSMTPQEVLDEAQH